MGVDCLGGAPPTPGAGQAQGPSFLETTETLGTHLCHAWAGNGPPGGWGETQGRVTGAFGDLGAGCDDAGLPAHHFRSCHIPAPCEGGALCLGLASGSGPRSLRTRACNPGTSCDHTAPMLLA